MEKGKEEIVYETCDSGSSGPNQLTTVRQSRWYEAGP